jgi:hypothetical protein
VNHLLQKICTLDKRTILYIISSILVVAIFNPTYSESRMFLTLGLSYALENNSQLAYNISDPFRKQTEQNNQFPRQEQLQQPQQLQLPQKQEQEQLQQPQQLQLPQKQEQEQLQQPQQLQLPQKQEQEQLQQQNSSSTN